MILLKQFQRANMNDEYRTISNPFESLTKYDPIHAMFLKKKQQEMLPDVIKHNQSDVEELQEFCKRYGIAAINCGNMHPKAAMQMLKRKLGIIETPEKTVERILLKG
jgi:hypothetical protein